MSCRNSEFQPGDIAACWGQDLPGRLISLATWSPFGPGGLRWGPSHVALITHHRGIPLWVESTTLAPRPCRVLGRRVAGVQAHDPAARIADYRAAGGRVVCYRLVPIEALSNSESMLLDHILIEHFVRPALPYSLTGALLSGTRVFQWTRLFPLADLRQLFCSELIAAVYMRLGRLPRDNPTRYSPARLLRTLVRHGTCYPVRTTEFRI